jgi:hypothetical protein
MGNHRAKQFFETNSGKFVLIDKHTGRAIGRPKTGIFSGADSTIGEADFIVAQSSGRTRSSS